MCLHICLASELNTLKSSFFDLECDEPINQDRKNIPHLNGHGGVRRDQGGGGAAQERRTIHDRVMGRFVCKTPGFP